MTDRVKQFYENLIIDDSDKDNAVKALKSKGVEKHIQIKEKLLQWQNSDCIEYAKIASTYRYDKRIRNTLFKYISYLEEFYRSIILDNYMLSTKQKFWIKELREKLKEYNNNLNEALEALDFSSLLIQCQRLPVMLRVAHSFPRGKHSKDNSVALKELRNAVMHNKFLLLYRGFEVCYVQGVDNNKSASLKANILNLVRFLPAEVGLQCIMDINCCKENKNKDGETKWDLPPQVVISLKEK